MSKTKWWLEAAENRLWEAGVEVATIEAMASGYGSTIRTRDGRMICVYDTGSLVCQGKLIPELSATEARKAIEDGVITGGMIPKVETCIEAVQAGARAAVIIDGRIPHACLLELFTASGSGTLIRAD